LLGKPGRVAPRAKRLAEIIAVVRLADLGGREVHVADRRATEDRLQVAMHRDRERDTGLLLAQGRLKAAVH
jgi:hypothetical protein